ncbi:asparagine synthase (glutamine-hydrolyzing) [Streptomyces sp. NPDC001661]
MCRIFGHFDTQATPHELRSVAAAQRHGGPDAQTHATGRGWGLGNNRLAIMDLDGGDQPYTLGQHITVVFNGEIYNHQELREKLAAKGHTFADTCDGSVIPVLYAEYGPDFVDHLDGMYAVAVVDLRGEPTLWLATDEIGMKPLYYHWNPSRRQLYFASELPALLAFRGVPVSTWEAGLDSYLSTKTPFGEQTMFDGIRVLPPAATAKVTRGGFTLTRRTQQAFEAPHTTEEEAAAHLRELLRTEVERLTEADVPVSAITSGGLDSSFVTALAGQRTNNLHSFNMAYTGNWPADERHFAREVAEQAGSTHHQVEIDPATFPDLLEDVVWHLGQPNADPITLSTYALFGAVRDAGFKVAVTGDAADELFGGYDRLSKAVNAPAGSDWVSDYVEALAAVPRGLRESLYTSEYRHFVQQHGPAADAIADELRAARGDTMAALTEFEIGRRLPAYHLRRVDHLSMSSSVEVRLPFCQPSVVRYARSLPTHLKIDGERRKKVLYAAAADDLPHSVLHRPKQPFTLPITAMLRPGQPLMDLATDVLSADALGHRGQLNPAAVQGLLRTQAERPDDKAALAIWSLLIHELWLDQFGTATGRTTAQYSRLTEATA